MVAAAVDRNRAFLRSSGIAGLPSARVAGPSVTSMPVRWNRSCSRPWGSRTAHSCRTSRSSTSQPYRCRIPPTMKSISNSVGASRVSSSSRKAVLSIGPTGSACRNELRTSRRRSCTTLSRADFPEAFAPNTPAAGRTRSVCPASRHGTSRTTRGFAVVCASRLNETMSRKDLAFLAVNPSRTEC